jgi:hypothetical protein
LGKVVIADAQDAAMDPAVKTTKTESLRPLLPLPGHLD